MNPRDEAWRDYVLARNAASLARSKWLSTLPPWEDAEEELNGERHQITCAMELARERYFAKITG